MDTKTCTKCGETKAVSLFPKRGNGLQSHCKACRNTAYARYCEENKDKVRESRTRFREENPDKVREHQARYCKKNADKLREKVARYREENKDRAREYQAKRVKNMVPSYVARVLQISVNDLTPELLELKRQQLFLGRLAGNPNHRKVEDDE